MTTAAPRAWEGAEPAPLLSLRAITKTYGAVEALKGVDLDVYRGEVLAICGDNGAGKSSLIRIVSGAQEPTSGTITFGGTPVHWQSPHDALERGVATIYQDLALAPRLSITQNVFLGSELTRPVLGIPFLRLLDKRRMAEEARGHLRRLAVDVSDMRTPVERLSGGQRQAVAIGRALRWKAELIIMDEPTAALGVRETAQVLDLIRRLRAEGCTVVLISHNMADVVSVATRVVILKSGRKVAEEPTSTLDADTLAHIIMTGQRP